MYRKYAAFVLVWTCVAVHGVSLSYAVEIESKTHARADVSLEASDSTLQIVPYLGSSTLVGNFGVELQYRKFGYNIGLLKSVDVAAIDNILCGGIRYYFKPHNHSWMLGVGCGVVLDELKPDDDLCGEWSGDVPEDWVCDTGVVMDKYIGVLIGYRWIWWGKLRINIGAGPSYIDWKTIRAGGKHKYLPMVEAVVGYSFF